MYRRTAKHSDLIIMITLHDFLSYAKSLYSCAENISITQCRIAHGIIIK